MSDLEGTPRGEGKRIAIVVSRFNELVTERLLEGAVGSLREHGVAEDDLLVVRVPGAWELPGTVAAVLRTGDWDAVVALGCVIRGETPHFDFVAGEAARGLQELALREPPVPIALGLLTTDTREQALARAGGDRGNKGWEAALTALEMADLYERLESLAGA